MKPILKVKVRTTLVQNKTYFLGLLDEAIPKTTLSSGAVEYNFVFEKLWGLVVAVVVRRQQEGGGGVRAAVPPQPPPRNQQEQDLLSAFRLLFLVLSPNKLDEYFNKDPTLLKNKKKRWPAL